MRTMSRGAAYPEAAFHCAVPYLVQKPQACPVILPAPAPTPMKKRRPPAPVLVSAAR